LFQLSLRQQCHQARKCCGGELGNITADFGSVSKPVAAGYN